MRPGRDAHASACALVKRRRTRDDGFVKARLVAAVVLLASPASAACPDEGGAVARDVVDRATGRGALFLAAGGVAALPGGAFTGVDHAARRAAQGPLGGRYALEPVSVTVPWVLPGAAFVAHAALHTGGRCRASQAALRVVLATTAAFGAVTVAKVAVGRDWPNAGGDPAAPDRLDHPERARSFSPPSATRVAWPSGHTAVATAAAASLVTSYPEVRWLPWVAYGGAAATGALMILGDHHWTSDVVSGALLGAAVGGAGGAGIAVVPQREGAVLSWSRTF